MPTRSRLTFLESLIIMFCIGIFVSIVLSFTHMRGRAIDDKIMANAEVVHQEVWSYAIAHDGRHPDKIYSTVLADLHNPCGGPIVVYEKGFVAGAIYYEVGDPPTSYTILAYGRHKKAGDRKDGVLLRLP